MQTGPDAAKYSSRMMQIGMVKLRNAETQATQPRETTPEEMSHSYLETCADSYLVLGKKAFQVSNRNHPPSLTYPR